MHIKFVAGLLSFVAMVTEIPLFHRRQTDQEDKVQIKEMGIWVYLK